MVCNLIMRRLIFITAVRVSILVLIISLQQPRARAEEQGPLIGRIVDSVSQRLDYGLEAMVESEQWFSDGKPTFEHYELMPQLIWHYSPRYDFTIGFERDETYSVDDMGDRSIVRDNLGWTAVTVKVPLKEWFVSSRQEFEAGTSDTGDVYIWRQLVRVEYQKQFLPFKLMPFVENEYFLDLQKVEMMENRFVVGLSYPVNKVVNVELFGMRDDQWQPDGNSVVSPVVGLNVKVAF